MHSPAYFVAPSGDNANPGTKDKPFKTINYAVNKLKAGDALYVRAGVYAETVAVDNSGTANAPILIYAYPGEQPIIDASSLTVPDWSVLLSLNGNYVHAAGFELRNINLNGAKEGGYGLQILGAYSIASHMRIHDIWSAGALSQGDNSIIEDSEIYRTAWSNCRLPGTTNCNGGNLYPSGGWASGLSAARDPRGNLITDNAIIRRNIVHDCWGEGISSFEANGTIIEDNISFDNWALNLYISDTRNALVQRNIVYNTPNNLVSARSGFTLADERSDKPRSAYNKVINNFIYNADFCAFCWTEVAGSGLDNTLIANNTIIGDFATGANSGDINSSIINNIVTGSVSVPQTSGLSFSHNLWATSPPTNANGSGDVIGDPLLEQSGSTSPGQLGAGYFKIKANSPAIGHGLSLPQVRQDFFGTTRKNNPDIGGHEY